MADFKAVLDDSAVRRYFKSVKLNLDLPNKFLKAAYATIGFGDIIKHFNQERDSDGNKWQPLAESTLRSRARGRGRRGARILQDTGNLRQSFSATNTQNAGRGEIRIFNNAPYSGSHDNGIPERNLPQREFMYFTDRAVDDMGRFILEKIFEV